LFPFLPQFLWKNGDHAGDHAGDHVARIVSFATMVTFKQAANLVRASAAVSSPTVVVEDELSNHSTSTRVALVKAAHGANTESDRVRIKEEQVSGIIFPWNKQYLSWFGFTVVAAVLTVFTETYQVAFAPAGLAPYKDAAAVIELLLISIFVVDIFVNFRLAFRDENEDIIYDKQLIAKHYFRFMFRVDFIGVFPFYALVLWMTGDIGNDNSVSQYLALLRLLRLVRLHRMQQAYKMVQYNTHLSLMVRICVCVRAHSFVRSFVLSISCSHHSLLFALTRKVVRLYSSTVGDFTTKFCRGLDLVALFRLCHLLHFPSIQFRSR
jgi:hypothetical protein